MALSYTESGNNTASGSWAVSHPAASAGDLLIFNIGWDDSTDTTGLTPPSGPNGETAVVVEDVRVSSNTSVRGKIVYYKATGSWSASTITFTPSASEQWSAVVVKVPSGEFDATTPVGADNYFESTGTDSTPDLPSLTAGSTDGSGTVVGFMVGDVDDADGTITGWTSRASTDRGAVGVDLWTRNTVASDSESISAATGATYPSARDYVSFIYIIRVQRSPSVTLNSPADASSDSDTTPTLDFTGTDPNSDSVRYNVQIGIDSDFSAIDTYYFDVSDAGPTDSTAVWTDDANAFDGSTSTYARTTANSISAYLNGEGTNAPSSNTYPISQVRARFYGTYNGTGTQEGFSAFIYTNGEAQLLGAATLSTLSSSPAWSSYATLSTPTGGWDWSKLASLEVKIRGTIDGTVTNLDAYKVELEVTHSGVLLDKSSGYEPTIDHVTSLGNANSTSISASHTTTDHPNRLTLIVATVDAGTPNDVNSVTVGGNAATQLAESTYGNNKHAEIWYYLNPAVGSATVQVNTDSARISGAVYDIYNVDQADPFSGSASGQSTDGIPTVNITPDTAYSLLIDILCSDSAQANPDNGTLQHTQSFSFNETRSSSRRAIDTSSKTMSYGTGAGDWAMVVVAVKPVTADSGFANPDNGGDTDPFNSGENIQFTVQAGDALADGTYYWRVRGIDPSGTNTYGSWSSTRSFTISSGGGGAFIYPLQRRRRGFG